MTQETKNKMDAIIEAAKAKQLKQNTIKVITTTAPKENNLEKNIKLLSEHIKNDMTEEEKQTQTLTLKSLKIIWHEGRHIEGATFENTTFESWADIQKAFFILWDTNEKGEAGGYTKVKVCVSFNEIEATHTTRVDITNRIESGDFNPTQEHIFNYLKKDLDGLHDGKIYIFETFESLEIYDPAKEIVKEALTNINILPPINSVYEIEAAEAEKEDSIYNVELSTLTTAQLLGEVEEEKEEEFKTIIETPILKVLDYSEKAFAIAAKVGNTKPYKQMFEKLGGKFNPRLKGGATFIFSKKHLKEVAAAIVTINN